MTINEKIELAASIACCGLLAIMAFLLGAIAAAS